MSTNDPSIRDYRARQALCARCARALVPDETHLTREGEAVCRSCNTQITIAALPEGSFGRDGSLLLGLHALSRRLERRRFLARFLAFVMFGSLAQIALAEGAWKVIGLAVLGLLVFLALRAAWALRNTAP